MMTSVGVALVDYKVAYILHITSIQSKRRAVEFKYDTCVLVQATNTYPAIIAVHFRQLWPYMTRSLYNEVPNPYTITSWCTTACTY